MMRINGGCRSYQIIRLLLVYRYIYDLLMNSADSGLLQFGTTENVEDGEPGTTAEYLYDPLGRRTYKTADGETTRYVYAGEQVIEERKNDAVSKQYIYGNGIDEIVRMDVFSGANATPYYFHQDQIGNVTAITDGSGNVVERVNYDLYGKPTFTDGSGAALSQSSIGNTLLFQGREYDLPTHLYHFRARAYDPFMGRFLQTDPMGYADSMNLYQAFNMNPFNFTDPMGESIIVLAEGKYRDRYYSSIQKLTDDQLGIDSETGEISIIKEVSGKKTFGTALIRLLIQSKRLAMIQKYNENPINIVNEYGDTVSKSPIRNSAQAMNVRDMKDPNQGSDSLISIDTPSNLTEFDPKTGKYEGKRSGYPLLLGHELIHALHQMYGASIFGEEIGHYEFQGKERKYDMEEIITVGLLHKIISIEGKSGVNKTNVVENIAQKLRNFGLSEDYIKMFIQISENSLRDEQSRNPRAVY